MLAYALLKHSFHARSTSLANMDFLNRGSTPSHVHRLTGVVDAVMVARVRANVLLMVVLAETQL